jgi:hypothetical protein
VVNEFRRGATLGAQRLAGGVHGMGFEAREAAVFDDSDAAASGDAQRAIAMNALRAGGIGHGVLLLPSNARC